MNSGELASLAGVTVRALRHYHQVGVLPEPPRSHNGYRDYGVQHLISVLRIKRLAALGVPLERIPSALDGSGDDQAELLDQLDAELEAEISRLSAQRELVTHMRRAGVAPDLPPELAPFVALWAGLNTSPELAKMDHDQTILLAHLVGPEGLPGLVSMFERITEPELLARFTLFTERFDAITPDATDAELSEQIEPFLSAIAPIIQELHSRWMPLNLSRAEHLFAEHTTSTLNSGQVRALSLLESRIENLAPPAG